MYTLQNHTYKCTKQIHFNKQEKWTYGMHVRVQRKQERKQEQQIEGSKQKGT